jgi:hypothetical protein
MSDTTSDPSTLDSDATNSDYQDQLEARQQAGALQQAPDPQPNPQLSPQPAAPTTPADITNFQQLAAFQQQIMAARQKAEADHAAYYDPTRPRDDNPDQIYADLPKSGPQHGAIHDFGDRLWASTLQTGLAAEGVVSAAARAMDADPSTVAWIENQKRDVESHIQATLDDLSPQGKLALQASILHPFGGKAPDGSNIPSIADAGYGRWLSGVAADALPSLALAVLPGGIAANVAKATTFGLLDAGGAYNDMIKQIDAATPDQLMSSPVYKQLRDQGKSDVEARKDMLGILAPTMAAEHMAAGTVGGAGLGSMAAGKLLPKGLSLFQRAMVGGTEGAATMGAQAAADNAADQQFQGQATGKTFDPSETAMAAVSGALSGGAIGAGFGALHGGHTDPVGQSDQESQTQTPPLALTYDPIKKAWVKPTLTEEPNAVPGTPNAQTKGSYRTISMPTDVPPNAQTKGSYRTISMPTDVPPDVAVAIQGALPPNPAPEAAPTPNLRMQALPAPQPRGNANTAQTPDVIAQPDQSGVIPLPDQSGAQTPPSNTTVGSAPAPSPPQNLADVQSQIAAQRAPSTPSAPEPARGQAPAAEPPQPAVAPVSRITDTVEPSAPVAAASGVEKRLDDVSIHGPEPEIPASAGNLQPDAVSNATGHPRTAGNLQPDAVSNATGHPRTAGNEGEPAPAPPVESTPVGPTDDVPGYEAYSGQHAGNAITEPTTPRAALDAKVEAARQARALRKAQQAKPGEKIKPQAYVAPDTAEAAAEPEPEAPAGPTRADTMADLRARMAQVGAKIIKVRKGNDVAKAVSMAMREISDLVDTKNNTPEAVHDAIEKWGKPTLIPGTETRRVDVADDMMRLMTGKPMGAARLERAAIEARSEASRQANVHESEGLARKADLEASHAKDLDRDNPTQAQVTDAEDVPASPALTETAAEGEEHSQGVQDFGGSKEYSEDTTNRERKARDLIQKVREGRMTALEASREFDWERPRLPNGKLKAGPPPIDENRYLASFLDAEIKRAEAEIGTPETELERLIRTQRDGNLTLRGPEARLADLRAMRAELADPVRDAVQRESKARAKKKAETKISPRRAEKPKTFSSASEPRADGLPPGAKSAFVEASKNPDLDRMLADHISRNGTVKLHDLLDMITNYRGNGDAGSPLRWLARVLKLRAKNIDVNSVARAADLGLIKDWDVERKHGEYARYDSGSSPDHIVINTAPSDSIINNPGRAATILHEASHHVTSRYLDRLREINPTHRDLGALEAIRNELVAKVSTGQVEGVTNEELSRVIHALDDPDFHELHTMMMTDPVLQNLMRRTPVSAQFRARMSNLGFEPGAPTRSIWSHFVDWTRRALGLGPHNSASGRTLFDHIMGPGTEIFDRADRFNRGLPADPVVRDMAEPFTRSFATVGNSRDVLDQAVRQADLGAMKDSLRRGLLQASALDHIVKWNRDLFRPLPRAMATLAMRHNPLEAFRAAQEKISHTQAQVMSRWSDRVNSITRRMAGRDELAQLMNDATIEGVKLGSNDPNANDHVTDRAALQELQRRFDALTPADQQLYKDRRDHYAGMQYAERDAQRRAIVGMVMRDSTPAQRAALAHTVKSLSSIEAFLANPDTSGLAQAFGTDWQKNRQLLRGIAKIQKTGFVKGDYFPLRRFGDYVVSYGDRTDPEQYGVERFEKKHEAEARRAELLQQGVDDVSPVNLRRQDYNGRGSLENVALADELENAVKGNTRLAGDADEFRRLIDNILIENMSRSELTRTRARRRGVKGASIDAPKIDATEFLAHSVRMGYLEHGGDRSRALADMRLVADELGRLGRAGEQIRAESVVQELQQRAAATSGADGGIAALARRASNLGFIQSLMSPSHAITSSIEAHSNSAAILGARHGAGKAAAALTRALADVSPALLRQGFQASMKAMGQGLKQADWNLGDAARARLVAAGADAGQMQRLFGAADEAGLIDHTYDRDLRNAAQPGLATTTVGRIWGRFLDMNAVGAHSVDVANRSAILKAAFDLEMRKSGGSEAVSIQRALDTLRDAMPNYNYGNKARIATDKGVFGPFAGPITQFKQYGIHMYGVMANMLRESLHGADPQTRREARRAFAGILATHALMAGSLTLLSDPLRLIGGLYDWVTGAQGPHDYENDVRGFLSDTFGPELGEIVARGVPHAVGIDIHRRVGLANLLELPDLESFDAKGIEKMLATMAMGASGEDASTMAQGIHKGLQGDWVGAVHDMVPRVLRDPLTALQRADNGVVDSKGHVGLPADKISTFATIAQAVGFQPAEVSEFREGQAAVREAQQEAKTARSSLVSAWLEAEGDDRAAVMSSIRQFNATHPGQAITMPQLVSALRQRAQVAHQPATQSFGLRLPPKAAAALAQAGRFANIGS